MRINTIFLDLDDVLADFETGVLSLYNLMPGQQWVHTRQGIWDMTIPLGTTEQEFLNRIEETGVQFWESLLPLPWMRELYRLAESYAENVVVLSSTSVFTHAAEGKTKWLKNHFGSKFKSYIYHNSKHKLATENSLLIDDKLDNCREFIMAGGKSICFPSSGNPLYTLTGDIEYVRHLIEERCYGV